MLKEKNEWVLKTDMNINNNKIYNCSKQMSMIENKHQYWEEAKIMIAKKKHRSKLKTTKLMIVKLCR